MKKYDVSPSILKRRSRREIDEHYLRTGGNARNVFDAAYYDICDEFNCDLMVGRGGRKKESESVNRGYLLLSPFSMVDRYFTDYYDNFNNEQRIIVSSEECNSGNFRLNAEELKKVFSARLMEDDIEPIYKLLAIRRDSGFSRERLLKACFSKIDTIKSSNTGYTDIKNDLYVGNIFFERIIVKGCVSAIKMFVLHEKSIEIDKAEKRATVPKKRKIINHYGF